MSKFIIRNDDVAYDTDLDLLKRFCDICDKYGYRILQAIVPVGEYRKANAKMSNEEIVCSSDKFLSENYKLLEFLRSRTDLLGLHGLYHFHVPTMTEIKIGVVLLNYWGLYPHYFIPPFNEGNYPEIVWGLKVCQLSLRKGERLEDFLRKGTPTAPIMYLHSWRFDGSWYTLDQLEKCLRRLHETVD